MGIGEGIQMRVGVKVVKLSGESEEMKVDELGD